MTRDEIVDALRRCMKGIGRWCWDCPVKDEYIRDRRCDKVLQGEAADLIENQQRHIEALLKANNSLKDAALRRDAQIEKMSAGLLEAKKEIEACHNSANQLDAINSGLMSSNEKLAADRKALKNELCQYCEEYECVYKCSCDGCKWRDM